MSRVFVTEGTGWSTGSVPPSADVEDREDAMEWFVEEVLSGHLTSHGEGKTHSAKVRLSGWNLRQL